MDATKVVHTGTQLHDEVVELPPWVQQRPGTDYPGSAAFGTAMLWLSINRDVLIGISSAECTRLLRFVATVISWGDYRGFTEAAHLMLGALLKQRRQRLFDPSEVEV